MMKCMQIESVLKPSSLQSRLGPTAVVSRHEEGRVSWINVGKTVRLEHSSTKFSMLNTPQKANIYVAKVAKKGKVMMKCMQIESVLKPSSLQSRLGPNASFSESFENDAPESGVVGPQIDRKSILTMLTVIYKYSRFYTIRGSALAIISISLFAVQSFSDFSPSFFLGVLQALLGGVFANLYVTGINQLSDIEIDKVNKPHLVLASGELPVRTGVLVTSLYAIMGFCIGWSAKTWPLKLGLFLWYAVGTVYSVHLPFLRWKRFPVLAAFCMWSLLGAIVPIFFHLHAQTLIPGRTILLSKNAIFVFAFMSVHAIVMALLKDIPDVKGDKLNGIDSFASQFGAKRVFWIGVWLLEILYSVGILIGLSSTRFWVRLLMVIGLGIFGFTLWRKANLVDLDSTEATESFYQFIWKLFYAAYLLVPIFRF